MSYFFLGNIKSLHKVWIKYNFAQKFLKYFVSRILILSIFLTIEENIAHASSEYRKVKYIQGNIIFWYIFMDMLFHRFLKDF